MDQQASQLQESHEPSQWLFVEAVQEVAASGSCAAEQSRLQLVRGAWRALF